MSNTEYGRAVRSLLQARASEAEERKAPAPLPPLTDDQCAAVDEQAEFSLSL